MTIDLPAAVSFMATHGRMLDRRRLDLLLGDREGDGDHGVDDDRTAAVLQALDAHRNPDGGYGWGLEPDLRAPESQPVGAMHALEVLAEVAAVTPDTVAPDTVAPATGSVAVELCDWLDEHTRPDGGLPLALPVADPAGCVPLWVEADPHASSLQMTTQVAANAHLVARHDPAVAAHPWLARATAYCVAAIRRLAAAPPAHELLFTLRFLDAAADHLPDGPALLEHVGRYVPADGSVAVEGGSEGEAFHALDLTPHPDRPVRRLFTPATIAADVERLASGQQADGGWTVDFASSSPAAALEWRGYATVNAVTTLRANTPA